MKRNMVEIGARYHGSGECRYVVWGPFLSQVSVKILGPEGRLIPMEKDGRGYWKAGSHTVRPGARYLYRLEGSRDRPDPASDCQPEGIHKASQIIDHSVFEWRDENWKGMPLEDMIIYELHIGTFTPQGTFDSAAEKMKDLADLGINALNIMPVAQFPGGRNWGYDGAHPFAVQNTYGGPDGFKRFMDACHRLRMAVILDVVYNHLGPEGSYLSEFGPYFTEKYASPWGKAVNFDDAWSDEVRNFFIQNALHWFEHFHLDALRLDAVHAIYDMSARPFLRELKEEVVRFSEKSGRKGHLIAESDLNDIKIIRSVSKGGYGLDAQWCDDFHHALHSLLTGERSGYYVDFGRMRHLAKSFEEGFVLSGQYSAYRHRRHGNSSRAVPASRFIVFSQNHDQVGNRRAGERLCTILPFEALKLAAGAVLFSPYIPLLFMGEEYAETSPFLYFTGFLDPDLIEAVREGRKKEFKKFRWMSEPPDPQDPKTFFRSKLKWESRTHGRHGIMLKYYRRLIELRKNIPALAKPEKKNLKITALEEEKILLLHRRQEESQVLVIMNFSQKDVRTRMILPPGIWNKILDSSDRRWGGTGDPLPDPIENDGELSISAWGLSAYEKEISR
jgi:maltooligosyltrehalose trehalohydrolase